MDIQDYKSGAYKQQYEYKSFDPKPINHAWIFSDSEIQQLLSEAGQSVGRVECLLAADT